MANSTLIKDYLGVGTLAARPVTPPVAAGVAAFYFATDNTNTYVWSGSAWVQVNVAGATAVTLIATNTPRKPPWNAMPPCQM